ncbi:Protein of unknown function DUF3605 [Kalmanozyma brasiliensis GHG001]|uniref:Uncharacterized protein n=1 Tax=Kalmanozyma brasiliensis (strain GHG001) TaxID=1365824 RepID=V5EWF7_KALBG|nr:Protein of unknown function DUF3605 [Kalmanozyma brasiliensis GHG001]EST07678.1 Protein of unknown function DUF3605 [Kalmanozyma brasiliensis GHG001]
MLASSSTISRLDAPHTKHTALLLRGTRDGDLAATLSSTSSSSATPRAERKALFTWSDLLDIVSSGNLQSLSRHPDDLAEYFAWMDSVKSSYGSVTSFLLRERFTATKLLEVASSSKASHGSIASSEDEVRFRSAFKVGIECQILTNDWPYSVPSTVSHQVVWSYRPILHSSLVADSPLASQAWSIIAKRGLCGTLTSTGLTIPSLDQHAAHLPELKLATLSQIETEQLERALRTACRDLTEFIAHHWDLRRNEVAFFANPPSLQSVPSLAHFHVLVRPIA